MTMTSLAAGWLSSDIVWFQSQADYDNDNKQEQVHVTLVPFNAE